MSDGPDLDRPEWMGLLARAEAAELARLTAALGSEPAHDWLRPPETGTVMVRGRAGGTGAPFNLGEMTVTRCALRLSACGTAGYAQVQGRDKDQARRAALIDALNANPQRAFCWYDLYVSAPLDHARPGDDKIALDAELADTIVVPLVRWAWPAMVSSGA